MTPETLAELTDPEIEFDGVTYQRIVFGNELNFPLPDHANCPDCGMQRGTPHLSGCDIEQCPKCGLQLIGCDCWSGEGDA